MNNLEYTPEQMAGQRLMVGFEGTHFNSDLIFLIDTLKIGGLILFSQNIVDPDQVRDLCSAAQERAKACGQPPLFIAIDQEGGKVARLKAPFTEFAGNPHMRSIGDATLFADVTARELASIGINMNMAPVLDVALPGQEGIMRDRAFGDDPAWVAELGLAVIQSLQAKGIMAVAKHFPGIGKTQLDSHHDLPFLDESLTVLEKEDFPPFETAIGNRVAGIMLSHICYRQLDEEWPASLSEKIAGQLLRKRIGYQGVVMTDDLDMGAITRHFSITQAVHRVLAADIDIALICHKSPAIETAFEEILRLTTDDPAAKAANHQSLSRVMTLKDIYLSDLY
ncbi:MAG: beta-N-acetylhexosaminidase [Thermodesulfobacteriota bacterium]